MATLRTVHLNEIGRSGFLPECCGECLAADVPPLICEELDGGLALVDGYHRLAGMLAAGEEEATVIVADTDDFLLCREFGGERDAMTEAEWICHMWELAAELAE